MAQAFHDCTFTQYCVSYGTPYNDTENIFITDEIYAGMIEPALY